MTTLYHKPLLLLFSCLLTSLLSYPQIADEFSINDYVKILSDKRSSSSLVISQTLQDLAAKDSTTTKKILDEIEEKGDINNNYFKARFLTVKALWIRNRQVIFRSLEDLTMQLLKKALNAAYETGNDSLISEIAWNSGESAYHNGRTESATMYLLLAAELDGKIRKSSSSYRYGLLGGLLYKTRDYRKSIYYTLASIQQETDTSALALRYLISRYNTVAICFQRMNIYDSAFFYFNIANEKAVEHKDTIWQAIISGNKGQIYFAQKNYPVAKSLLFFDYEITARNLLEPASAANSMQWIARISLAEGKKDSALIQVREALDLIGKRYDLATPYYMENIYSATAEVYRAIGNKDSVLKYTTLYIHLHDSIERAIADSRLEIATIKMDNLQNELAIKNLQKEKAAAEQKRNLIIGLIVLGSIIALLYVNKMRLKQIHKEQLAKKEKEAAESSAREQLELLTQNFIEKTNLAEELQRQLNSRTQVLVQQELSETISNLTILTDSDWEKFKKLFEQLHPGFFMNLQEKVSDITLAELRMAALTRLHLSTNQIASILGISANSVYKTKQRLRHRLNLDSEANIEDVIARV